MGTVEWIERGSGGYRYEPGFAIEIAHQSIRLVSPDEPPAIQIDRPTADREFIVIE